MNIKKIRLVKFKNVEDSTIIFKDNMSGIYGPNGVGKTAIIEAISLVKNYFSKIVKEDTNRVGFFYKKLHNYIKSGETNTVIEITLLNEETKTEFILSLEFQKKGEEEFFCCREELSYKKVNSRALEKNLIKITYDNNKFFPELIITDFNKDDFNFEAIDSIKELLRKNDNFYSLIMQMTNLTDGLKKQEEKLKLKLINDISELEKKYGIETKKYKKNSAALKLKYIKNSEKIQTKVSKDSGLVLEQINIVRNILENVLTVELKDQLLCRETISIPIKCFENNKVKTITYNEDQNIYNEDEADLLTKTIKEINSIISIIIPNSELATDVQDEGKNAQNIHRKSVVLYMIKDGSRVPLVSESTGTIKLVSLISILIYCLKNKKASVFIDEIDVHIFEYLLATLLLVIGKYLKGQLVFTGHNLLPMEKLNKDSIIIATKNEGDIRYTFIKTNSKTNNVRLKYLKSQTMWSEENINPLLLNIPKLEVFIQRLVLK